MTVSCRGTWWAVPVLVLSLGCQRSRDPAAEARALDRATAAARELGQTLRGRLQQTMNTRGLVAAIEVCSTEAPAQVASVRARTGVTVGRSSLRLRSPADAPPPWVAAWLQAQGERPAASATPLRRVDTTPEGPRARVILPIAIEAPCVMCHGERESMPPALSQALTQRYPGDRAVGYRLGDLRGALWAEAPLDR